MITKAAFIPYYEDKILVCKSSNPMYGGPDFALAKGMIDPGESEMDAAIREAQEELGLRSINIKGSVKHLGNFKTFSYILSVYWAEVHDPDAFDDPCWEIAETKWMTWKEFRETGRSKHRPVVDAFFQQLVH